MQLPGEMQKALDRCVDALAAGLRSNLHTCALYGSAVRGDLDPKTSDLNLFIVLEESTPEAHAVIAEAIRGRVRIEPLVVGRRGLDRTFRSFAIKFRSIRRNHRILHGVDPFSGFHVEDATVRFECEQGLRNLRLRTVHAFTTFGREPKRYRRHLDDVRADVLVLVSEALRLGGEDLPNDPSARLPALTRVLGVDVAILDDLIALGKRPRSLSRAECADYHARLFRLLDGVIAWMEARWPT